MKTLIIANHVAAKAQRAWPGVKSLLEANRIEFELHETTHAGDATTRTRQALHSGCQTIVVLGGDGTLSEAAEGFFELTNDVPMAIKPGAALGVLPAGTGDDFARGLRDTRAPLEDWIKTLASYRENQDRVRVIDLLYGRCDDYSKSFICINASTLGIGGETGARVAAQGDFLRRFSGEARFMLAAAGAVAAWRERRVRVTIDDELLADNPMNLVAVANNRYAGAGMLMSPEAKIDDGKLDVVIASGFSRLDVVRELPRLHTGGHVANPKVQIKQGCYVRVETFALEDGLQIEADGNVRGKTPADYRVMAGALRFVC
jgi:diacylglycerol kinase (ATP)